MPPEIMDYIFRFVEKRYNFRNNYIFQKEHDKKVYYESEILFSLAQRILELILNSIKI